jgi:hypothetical protein
MLIWIGSSTERIAFDLAGAFIAFPLHPGLKRGRKKLLGERYLVLEDDFQIDKNNWIVKVAFSKRLTGRKGIDEFDNSWLVEDQKQKILERGNFLRGDYQNRQINFWYMIQMRRSKIRWATCWGGTPNESLAPLLGEFPSDRTYVWPYSTTGSSFKMLHALPCRRTLYMPPRTLRNNKSSANHHCRRAHISTRSLLFGTISTQFRPRRGTMMLSATTDGNTAGDLNEI